MNNPTAHTRSNTKKVQKLLGKGDPALQYRTEMVHPEVVEKYAFKYIKEKWAMPNWKYGKFLPPEACLRSYKEKAGENYPDHKTRIVDYV